MELIVCVMRESTASSNDWTGLSVRTQNSEFYRPIVGLLGLQGAPIKTIP